MTTFRISGTVIDQTTRTGLVGLRVEAWDKDLICDDLVGSSVTNDQGAFQIEFDESYFQELFLDRRPDIFFKVFREDELIKSTEDSVLWNIEAGETSIVIEVTIRATRDLRREILMKAVIDPSFRRRLLESPQEVFATDLADVDQAAIERIRKFLPALNDLITSLAGEVLCGGGGGCGGLA